MDTLYVWHIGTKGVYKAVKVHANGYIRPKSVSFSTELAAYSAWLKQIQNEIDCLTRQIKLSKKETLVEKRKQLRKQEKEIVKKIRELNEKPTI